MNRIHILLLALLTSLTSLAQTDQLITLKGDTLIGKSAVSSNNSSAIQTVSIKNGKDKHRFKVHEVKSLKKGKDVYYTIKVQGVYQLGLIIKEGYLSIYKIMDSESTSSTAFETAVLIKKDGSQLIVPNIGFRKFTSKFLNDCDIVTEGFEDKIYKQSDLEQIVDDYNECVDKNTESTRSQPKAELAEINQSKVAQTNALIESINEDGTLQELNTVIEMLNDLKSKLSNGVKVPSYLQNALKNSLKSNPSYSAQIAEILK